MDPASFSFAVIGMFITCCKGYAILSNAYNAPSDAKDAARRVRIEEAVLDAWGAHFEIEQGQQSQQGAEKLRIYLTRDKTRGAVFEALCAISNAFTDISGLDKKYGVVFSYHSKRDGISRIPRDVQDFLDGREPPRSPYPGEVEGVDNKMNRDLRHHKTKMSLLQRCRWSLRGKERFRGLIKILREYNDHLVRLCTWEAQAQINRGLASLTLSQSKNFMELLVMVKISEEAAQDKTSPMADGRHRIAEMARFKAKLMTPSKVLDKYETRWRLLDRRDYVMNSTSISAPYSLGESLRKQNPVFVEWQSYRDGNNKPDKVAEN